MGCWKCSCGHYVDTEYDRCIFCQRPKPGTVKQGDIEYAITFVYVQKGTPHMETGMVKGPVNISTGADHLRLNVTGIASSGAATEYLSFSWENSIPHGNPLQIWPVAEGGFEVTCLSPSFTINGMVPGPGKTRVEAGSILMLAPTMAIKLEDFRGPSFIEGSISPVGLPPRRPVDPSDLFRPNGEAAFYNGLNYMTCTKYENSGISKTESVGPTDWEYVNKYMLAMFGIKFKNYRDTVAALKEGRS